MKKQNINQYKNDFISGCTKPAYSYAEYFENLIPYLGMGYRSYDVLTRFHINHASADLKEEDFLDFYKVIYDFWYDSISNLSFFEAGTHRKVIKAILKDKKFAKENMTGADCEKFFFETLPNEFKDLGLSPVITQHRKVPCQNGEIEKDFLHVYPFKNRKFSDPLDVRLYMNIPPINASIIGMLLTSVCKDQSLPLYFKFWTKANQRNDQFLVYTTYKDAPKIVEILNQIKQEYPHLFIGATLNNSLYSKVNDYIYFGETPNSELKSFNSARAKAFDEYFKKFLYENLSSLIQKDEPIIIDDNKISPKKFLVELMKSEYFKALQLNQEKISKGQFPNATIGDTVISSQSAADFYISEQNRIYQNALKNEFELDTLVKFEDAAEFMIAHLKRGDFPKLVLHIKHQTKTLGVSGQTDEEEIKELENLGHISYYERIGIFDYINTLLAVYHISDNYKAHIDTKSLNEILEKYNLSPENSSLNQTTAQNLNLVKERE